MARESKKAEPHLVREHVPNPDPKHVGLTTYYAKDHLVAEDRLNIAMAMH